MDRLRKINFFKRLESFVSNVEVGDLSGEEEKEMILSICKEYQIKNSADIPPSAEEIIKHIDVYLNKNFWQPHVFENEYPVEVISKSDFLSMRDSLKLKLSKLK